MKPIDLYQISDREQYDQLVIKLAVICKEKEILEEEKERLCNITRYSYLSDLKLTSEGEKLYNEMLDQLQDVVLYCRPTKTRWYFARIKRLVPDIETDVNGHEYEVIGYEGDSIDVLKKPNHEWLGFNESLEFESYPEELVTVSDYYKVLDTYKVLKPEFYEKLLQMKWGIGNIPLEEFEDMVNQNTIYDD